MKVRNHAFKENFDIFSISKIGVPCGALLTIIPNLQYKYMKRNFIRLQKRLSFVLIYLPLLFSFKLAVLA
jgi:hypothetical protein